MSRLERLVYGSTATGRTDNLLNMATLLAQASRNNARDGLTGALAAHENRFIQVIEEPSDALDRLLRRLGEDNRHRDIVIMGREPVERRLFSDWGMANARITPAVQSLLNGLMAETMPSPHRIVAMMLEAVSGD